jgi:hypothetical protein
MIKKYISNINKNSQNYSIILFVDQERLNISLKCINNYSNNSYQYLNNYSYRQLTIISKYFKNFDNLEQIVLKLNQELKNSNLVSIEDNIDYIILSIIIKEEKESYNIYFKLLQNNVTNKFSRNSKALGINILNNYSRGIPNINYKDKNNLDTKDIKSMLADLHERLNLLESSMTQNQDNGVNKTKYDPKKNSNRTMDNINNDNSLMLVTINNMLSKMDEIERSNQLKDKRIHELEYILRKQKTVHNFNFSMVEKPKGLVEDNQKKSDYSQKSKKSRNSNKLKNINSKSMIKDKKKYKNSIASSSSKEIIKKINENKYKSGQASPHPSVKQQKNEQNNEKNEEEKNHESDHNSSKQKINRENEEKLSEKKDIKSSKQSVDLNSKNYNEEENNAQTNLPMVGREDLQNYINSRIFFTKKELIMVKRKILRGQRKKVALFDVLYRATIDGDYEDIIIAQCEGIYPQLIMFYTLTGARFGIYIEKEKHVNLLGNVSYKEVPGTSFLISLNSLQTFNILEGKKATDDRPEKLCFGRSFMYNKNGSNWLIYTPRNEFLGVKCMIGDQEGDFGKINTDEIVGYNKIYQLKEVEIFKVTIEPEENFSADGDKKTK